METTKGPESEKQSKDARCQTVPARKVVVGALRHLRGATALTEAVPSPHSGPQARANKVYCQ